MKVHLMYRDQNFVLDKSLPSNYSALEQDLGLGPLFDTMAQGDKLVYEVVRKSLLCSLTGVDAVLYRQGVIADCLDAPDVVRAMYRHVGTTLETRRKNWLGIFGTHPSGIIHSAVTLVHLFTDSLMTLRGFADTEGYRFQSDGFRSFFAMLQRELDDDYISRVREHLNHLSRPGILVRAQLGRGHRGTNYTLVVDPNGTRGLIGRLLSQRPTGYTLHVDARDEAGHRTLEALEDAGLNLAANALAQSADHIKGFFEQLQTELAFLVGCLNVADQMIAKGDPLCMPEPWNTDQRVRHFRGLYDLGLSLRYDGPVVGNDLDADRTDLIIVTGANQGGKSTFLRSVGVSQLMMQAGMFVPANSFAANVCEGLFTHFRREEDADMNSGKLDEELQRMSSLADHLAPNSLILFNESFASTNEREGSEIFQQITDALLESGIQMVSVSHMYAYAQGYYARGMPNAVFLRAERDRTFKLKPGRPITTSYGRDLYEQIFNGRSIDSARSLGSWQQDRANATMTETPGRT